MWGQVRDRRRSVIVEIRTYGRAIRRTMGRGVKVWRTICVSIASPLVLAKRVGEQATAGIGCNIISASFALLDLD